MIHTGGIDHRLQILLDTFQNLAQTFNKITMLLLLRLLQAVQTLLLRLLQGVQLLRQLGQQGFTLELT